MIKYAFLEPIQAGGLTLRNHVISLAMAKDLSTDDFFVTDQQIEYYANTARDGAARGDYEEGRKVHFAEKVTAKVSVPVAATGSLRHPDLVSQIITEGQCDLVDIGRGLLADPDYVKMSVWTQWDEDPQIMAFGFQKALKMRQIAAGVYPRG